VQDFKRFGLCLLLGSLLAAEAAAAEHAPIQLPSSLSAALRYSVLESGVFAQARDGRLDNRSLFRAALIAGGVHDETTLRTYLVRYGDWRRLLRRECGAIRQTRYLAAAGAAMTIGREGTPDVRRAAKVLAFLHREILTGKYDIRCSGMSEVANTGRYNCVSATILFNSLAAEVGLTAHGGEAPAHVLSILDVSKKEILIETTCSRWFEIAEGSSAFRNWRRPGSDLGVTRRSAVRRSLSPAQLVAIVYYNQGVDLAEQHDYADAVAANYKALQLDPHNSTARGNLLAAVNNWALDLAEQKRFAKAVTLLQHGRQIAPEHQSFTVNQLALYQQWIHSLRRRGDFDRATSVLKRAAAEFPNEPYFHSALIRVFRQSAKPVKAPITSRNL